MREVYIGIHGIILNRASDFFQDRWAEVTHGAKIVGHFAQPYVDIWVVFDD